MFEINVPYKGTEFLEEKKNTLIKELNSTSDYAALKMKYRELAGLLVDDIEVKHDLSFNAVLKEIESHMLDCGFHFHSEPFISDESIQKFNSAISEIISNHHQLIDDYSEVSEFNYPVNELRQLFDATDNINGGSFHSSRIDLVTGEKEPLDLPNFDKAFVLKRIMAVARITESLYRDRVQLEAIHSLIDYMPGNASEDAAKTLEVKPHKDFKYELYERFLNEFDQDKAKAHSELIEWFESRGLSTEEYKINQFHDTFHKSYARQKSRKYKRGRE
ncbi:MAG: hypothetical protein LC641_01860 [Spirochaeta sp.]|nr:hypothetical protein [Spirochaeta sp.]